MKISLNSGLFSVTPPCCYWVFQEYLRGIECQEMEYQAELAEEEVKIVEYGQPWLHGLDKKVFDGKAAYRTIKRKDLPQNHPEHARGKEAELDWAGAGKIISRAWLDVFEERIGGRYAELGRGSPAKVRYVGASSPREYNFSHDKCVFTLSVPKSEMNTVIKEVLEGARDGFSGYLRECHTSYPGFWSFMSNDVTDYDGYWGRFKKGGSTFADDDKQKHLLWAVLDYWLFPSREDRDLFDRELWDKVQHYEGNGAFSGIMTYSPIGEDGAA